MGGNVMKKVLILVIALMLIPAPAFASRHNSYTNSDTRYGKRAHMLKSLGINHHSYTIRKKK